MCCVINNKIKQAQRENLTSSMYSQSIVKWNRVRALLCLISLNNGVTRWNASLRERERERENAKVRTHAWKTGRKKREGETVACEKEQKSVFRSDFRASAYPVSSRRPKPKPKSASSDFSLGETHRIARELRRAWVTRVVICDTLRSLSIADRVRRLLSSHIEFDRAASFNEFKIELISLRAFNTT